MRPAKVLGSLPYLLSETTPLLTAAHCVAEWPECPHRNAEPFEHTAGPWPVRLTSHYDVPSLVWKAVVMFYKFRFLVLLNALMNREFTVYLDVQMGDC
jgi:hypothetical protein